MDKETDIIDPAPAQSSDVTPPTEKPVKKRGFFIGLLLDFLIIFIVIASLVNGVFWWRILQGPINLDFVKPVIEMVFSNNKIDADISFDKLTVALADIHAPLQLTAEGVALKKNNDTILGLGRAYIEVAKLPLLWLQVAPVSFILEQPSLKLVRRTDNTIDFLSVRYASKHDDAPKENILENLVQGLWYSAPGEGWSITRNLQSLVVKDASAVVDDHLLGMSWAVPQMSMELQRTAETSYGSIVVKLEEIHEKPEFALTAYRDFITAPTDINLQLQDLDITLILQKMGFKIGEALSITGDVNVDVSPLGIITDGRAELKVPAGRFPLSDILGKTKFTQTDVGETTLKARFSPDENIYVLEALKTQLNKQDVILSGTMSADLSTPHGYIAVKTPRVAVEEVAKLFPEGMAGKENLEKWIMQKLSKGSAINLKLGMDLKGFKDEAGLWDFETDGEELSFDFENMDVDYEKPLPPLRNATGHANLEEGTLSVKISKGQLGGAEVLEGEGYVTNLTVDQVGEAVIKAKIKGSVKNILSYIASEPIGITEQDHGLRVAQVDGTALLDVAVRFPTLKEIPKDVFKVSVNGTLDNLQLPDIFRNFDLQGGPYTLTVDEGNIALSGSGALAADRGRWPVTIDYAQPFEPVAGKPRSTLKARGSVDNNFLRLLDVDLKDFFTETVDANVSFVEQAKGTGVMEVSADLTPTNINVKALHYKKPVGEKGVLSFALHLKDEVPQKISDISLTVPNGSIPRGEMLFNSANGKTDIASASLPAVKLGRNDFALGVKKTNNTFRFDISGKAFDAEGVLEGGNSAAAPEDPGTYANVKVAEVYASDNGKLENVEAIVDVRADGVTNAIHVKGQAGRSPFAFDYTLGGNMVMRTADAGAFLAAMGIFPDMIGGQLTLEGKPWQGRDAHPNDVEGVFNIEKFKVVKTPVLARLINALSLPGILGLLSNEGLEFSRFKGEFQRETLKNGAVITTVKDAATSGASIGLTMDGQINNTTKEMNIGGTVVPLSEVNSIIGNIPLIGQLLTGGGSLIAFTYSITGTTDKQDVFVNPLSGLTPGIIRRILFENSAPTVKGD